MKTFNILAEFRDVLAHSDDPNPYNAIDDVIARLPSNATGATLRLIIRDCLVAVAPTMAGAVNRESVTPSGPAAEARQVSGTPRKLAGLCELKLLRRRVAVGEGAWKFVGDSTPDEIDVAAEWREKLSASNAVAAKHLRRIAEVARQCGAEFIRDVPIDDLREFER